LLIQIFLTGLRDKAKAHLQKAAPADGLRQKIPTPETWGMDIWQQSTFVTFYSTKNVLSEVAKARSPGLLIKSNVFAGVALL